MSAPVEIRELAFGSPAYEAACALRDLVLRRPIGLRLADEDLSGERGDCHLGAYRDGRLVGVSILTPLDGDSVRMRQVGVLPSEQGRGVGSALVAHAERLAASRGFSRIVLDARRTAAAFYEGLGYRVVSGEFLEVGIPHCRMEKPL